MRSAFAVQHILLLHLEGVLQILFRRSTLLHLSMCSARDLTACPQVLCRIWTPTIDSKENMWSNMPSEKAWQCVT